MTQQRSVKYNPEQPHAFIFHFFGKPTYSSCCWKFSGQQRCITHTVIFNVSSDRWYSASSNGGRKVWRVTEAYRDGRLSAVNEALMNQKGHRTVSWNARTQLNLSTQTFKKNWFIVGKTSECRRGCWIWIWSRFVSKLGFVGHCYIWFRSKRKIWGTYSIKGNGLWSLGS